MKKGEKKKSAKKKSAAKKAKVAETPPAEETEESTAKVEDIEVGGDDTQMIAEESAPITEEGLGDIESVVDLGYFDDVAHLEEPPEEDFSDEEDRGSFDDSDDQDDESEAAEDEEPPDDDFSEEDESEVAEDHGEEPEAEDEPAAEDDAGSEGVLPADEPPGSHLGSVIEALLFVAKEPLTVKRLSSLLSGIDTALIRKAIADLQAEFAETRRAFQIVKLAGGYQLLTKPRFAEYTKKLQRVTQESRITPAALQTLAMVAYKQPVTRSEIDTIRGADSSTHVRTLLDKNLIRPVGRKKVPGYPLLYGTTRHFLEVFGMGSIKDLPQSTEFAAEKAN